MRLISTVAPCTSRGGVSYRAKPKLRRGPHRREHRAAHEFGLRREGEDGFGLLGHAVAWSATVDKEVYTPSPTTFAPLPTRAGGGRTATSDNPVLSDWSHSRHPPGSPLTILRNCGRASKCSLYP